MNTQQLQSQIATLNQVENQLQAVIDSQAQLLGNIDATSREHKELSLRVRSEMSEMATVQIQSQITMDSIVQTVSRIDSKMGREPVFGDATNGLPNKMEGFDFERSANQCLQSLFITDPAVDRREIETRKDKLMESSCDWVLDLFRIFEKRDSAKIFWLHGAPGKGKTMIAMALVDDLHSRVELDPKSFMGYFFCDTTSSRRNTLLDVMKSMLRQILSQLLSQKSKTTINFLNEFNGKGESMFISVEAVWVQLQKVISWGLLENIYFVIDALDECDDVSIDIFLTLLLANIDSRQNRNSSNAGTNYLPTKVVWVILSRNETLIREHLGSTINIVETVDLEVYRKEVGEVVDRLIHIKVRELAELKRYDIELTKYVTSTLQARAGGTPMWVSLVCRELRKPSVRSISTKYVLEKLPPGLTQLYDRILERIMSNEIPEMVEYAMEILRAVCLAIEPLNLGELGVVAGLPLDASPAQVEEYLELCGSFLALRGESQAPERQVERPSWRPEGRFDPMPAERLKGRRVFFVHQSAKDYLLKAKFSALFSVDVATGHEAIALRSLRYIAYFENRADIHRSDLRNAWVYPMRYWIDHGTRASLNILSSYDFDNPLFKLGSKLSRDWMAVYGAMWTEKHSFQMENVPITHLAAFLDADFILERIFSSTGGNRLDVDLPSEDGSTALKWAVDGGSLGAAIWLLEKGADPKKGVDPWLALSGPAKNFPEVLDALIRYGYDINNRNEKGETSLLMGSKYNNIDGAIELLRKGADPNIADNDCRRPLHFAVQGLSCLLSGKEDFELLLELLAHGADPNAPDNALNTPLHLGTQNRQVTEILMQWGADPNIKNAESCTPLDWASDRAHPPYSLLSSQAPLESRSYTQPPSSLLRPQRSLSCP